MAIRSRTRVASPDNASVRARRGRAIALETRAKEAPRSRSTSERAASPRRWTRGRRRSPRARPRPATPAALAAEAAGTAATASASATWHPSLRVGDTPRGWVDRQCYRLRASAERARRWRGATARAGARCDPVHQHRQVQCARGRPERVHDRAVIRSGRRAAWEGALSDRVVTVDADVAATDPFAPSAQCQPNCEHFQAANLSIPPLTELPCAHWQAMRKGGAQRVMRRCQAVLANPAVPTQYTRRVRRCKPRRQDSAACSARLR